MNDIKISEYGEVAKSWNLVTVRYRTDTNEMRFTYANDIAFNALKKGLTPLPEGSVFSKIGFKSGLDPAFESSVVPSGARRFQYMVKNSKKYFETNGWGYALFNSDGQLYETDIPTQTRACHACHAVVSERDYVFSEPIENSPFVKSVQKTYDLQKNKNHIRFIEGYKPTQGNLRQFLRKQKIKDLHIVDSIMRQYYFDGTFDEIVPVLTNYILAQGKKAQAAGFVSENEEDYVIVRIEQRRRCGTNKSAILKMLQRKGRELITQQYCL
jgi:hypothetical protein